MENTSKKILIDLLNAHPKTYDQFLILKKKFSGKYGLAPVTNATLIKAYRQMKNNDLPKNLPTSQPTNLSTYQLINLPTYLTKRATRTLSGVTPVTVLTKPYPCPGNCVYCPSEPGMPKSYLSNEPAAQRAKSLNFNPARQTAMRIKALELNGHTVDKIELLVLGGCFNAYPRAYQKSFIKKCFDACNNFSDEHQGRSLPRSGGRKLRFLPAKNLEQAFKKNETAKYRIIGITVETRPDLINEKEVKWFRDLGITRVQLGVQHLDDKILKLTKRGHTVKQTAEATKLLKQAGLKIDYHLMPDLPGSTPAKDLQMFKTIFSDERFQPDQIKIYPTVVNEYAPLYQWLKSGKHKPYSPKKLISLLTQIKLAVPYYVRINRLIRDIPKESIKAGNKITNLRQFLQKELEKQGKKCKCMRCREARESISDIKKAKLFTEKYRASDGIEYFVSFESPKRDKLYAFLRFRINNPDRSAAGLAAALPDATADSGSRQPRRRHYLPELNNAALVRELHTYGQLLPVDQTSDDKTPRSGSRRPRRRPAIQHTGFGKRLMKIAEELTKKHGLNKIAVISGIGVRQYYRKLGYRLQGTYMIKFINPKS